MVIIQEHYNNDLTEEELIAFIIIIAISLRLPLPAKTVMAKGSGRTRFSVLVLTVQS
jgi:hypothetical protein